jgi:hypothetical protein
MDGTKTIYANAPANTANLLVLPAGSNPTLSVSALGEAFIASGLALQIAQAISQSGISLVGAPSLLYNGSIQNTAGTPAGFGTNFSDGVPASYGCAGGNSTAAFQCSYTAFDSLITPQVDGASKLFNNASLYPLVPDNKQQAAINKGHRLYLCYQPGALPTSGQVTSIQQTTTDQNNLLASVNAMIAACAAAGTGATVEAIVLYQEYDDNDSGHNITAPVYQSAWNYYANFLHAHLPTLNIVACVGSGTASQWNNYVNSGLTFISGLMVDYYGSSFNKGVLLDSGNNGGAVVGGVSNNIIAIAAALNIPWCIGELGRIATSNATVPTTTQMKNYFTYIAGVVAAWVGAGHSMLDCMWFNGQSGSPNIISTLTDPLVSSPANLLQNFIAAISSVPITGIGAGVTAVLPPITPSPVAGYATAQAISYDITVNLIASAGSTVPFAAVELAWFNTDDTTAQPVAVQQWTLPAGTTGTTGTFIVGAGPQRGQFLQISITNLDTVQMSVTIQLNATGRITETDDWFWDPANSVTVPTFQLVNANAPFSNQIAVQSGTTLLASTAITRLCGMFAGETYIRFNASGAGVVSVQLNPVPATKGGGGTWLGACSLLNEQPNGEFEATIVLPRCPTEVIITNTDGANSHVVNFEMVALR